MWLSGNALPVTISLWCSSRLPSIRQQTSVTLNHHSKYPGQRSFRCKIIVRTFRQTDRHTDTADRLHYTATHTVVGNQAARGQRLVFKDAAWEYNLIVTGGRRQLRSWDNFKCTIICTSSRLGDRAFAAAGPRLWNSLPTYVRRLDLSLDTFRRKLTTYLSVRGTSAVTVASRRCVQIFLLT